MGKRSFAMGLALAVLTATVVIFANGGAVAAGPKARLAEAAKGQALPARADAEAMFRTARSVLKALQAGDEMALFDVLAPWQRQAEALKHQRALAAFEESKQEWKYFAARLKRKSLDPRNKFKLESPASIKVLSPPQYSALIAGVYRVHGDPEAATRLKGRWYGVDAETGQRGKHPEEVAFVDGGAAVLETVEGDRLLVRAVPSASGWQVVSYELRIRGIRVILKEGGNPGSALLKVVVREAKENLGTIKDRIRVYYVQNNNALAGANSISRYIPESFTELNGEHYSSWDYDVNDQDPDAVTITVGDHRSEGRPMVEYTFNVVTGKSDGGFVVTLE